MNVVDSSGWLEYLAEEEGASFFAPAIKKTEELLVPSIVLFEVYKKVLRAAGKKEALSAVVVMNRGKAVPLDGGLALEAAHLGLQHRLAMADSIIYAVSVVHGATLWTQDADLGSLPGVKYRPKKGR